MKFTYSKPIFSWIFSKFFFVKKAVDEIPKIALVKTMIVFLHDCSDEFCLCSYSCYNLGKIFTFDIYLNKLNPGIAH